MKRPILFLGIVVLLSGCSPRLSPLYRDYDAGPEVMSEDSSEVDDGTSVTARIRSALVEAGWEVVEPVTPNVVATSSRTFRQWGLYTVTVQLEVAPLSGRHVRMFVHPYRVYVTGAKRKIPYLRGSLARSVMQDLHASFDAYGLEYIGTAQSRDKQVTLLD